MPPPTGRRRSGSARFVQEEPLQPPDRHVELSVGRGCGHSTRRTETVNSNGTARPTVVMVMVMVTLLMMVMVTLLVVVVVVVVVVGSGRGAGGRADR